MRQVIEKQYQLIQTPISKIKLDLNSRDEIPQFLLGLQVIDGDLILREQVYAILEKIIPGSVNLRNGRPGMDLWNILVLGGLRLNCNWDYDKVHNMANGHVKIREFMGIPKFDTQKTFGLQTIKDNVALLTPEILGRINTLVVNAGHRLIGKAAITGLNCRCDSFVLETNVHFPTDANILLDAFRKTLIEITRLCDSFGINEWRQYKHVHRKAKRLLYKITQLKRSRVKNPEKKKELEEKIVQDHIEYVDFTEKYFARARARMAVIKFDGALDVARIMLIEKFLAHGERQIDQIRRRVVNGETIPHHEKIFSIFEEHTEWISKGKAGVPQELGLRVCILEDQFGFIIHHHVMEKETDDKVAVSMVDDAKKKLFDIVSCSFDKGFHSPKNKKHLNEMLDKVILPKKGHRSEQEKAEETSEDFMALRRRHSAVESAINALENHGLDRCPDHGIKGFKRYVALAVVARNIQKLGALVQNQKIREEKKKKEAVKQKLAA